MTPKFNLAGISRRCWIFAIGQLSAFPVWGPIFLGDCRACAGANVPSERIHLCPLLEKTPSLCHLKRGNPEAACVNIHGPSGHPNAQGPAQLLTWDHHPSGWLGSRPQDQGALPFASPIKGLQAGSRASPWVSPPPHPYHLGRGSLSYDGARQLTKEDDSAGSCRGPPRIMTKTISSPSGSLSLIISSEFN